jgi:hypothetical protein
MRRANEVDHGRHTLTRVVHLARTGTETAVGEDAGLAFLVGSP